MKRFYLFCNAGMSTSFLASRMQKVAEENHLPIEVKAFSDAEMDTIVTTYHLDVILLGPQVKYLLDKVTERYGKDCPVMVIDSKDYGVVDGERVLKAAMMAYKEGKKHA